MDGTITCKDRQKNKMNAYRQVKILVLCVAALISQPIQAQGILDQIMEKASEAWNSDTRKEMWEKAQRGGSELMEKIKEGSSELLADYTYKVPITEREFVDVIPEDYLLSFSASQYKSCTGPGNISSDAAYAARVKRVAGRLAKAVERFYKAQGMSDAYASFQWEFNLIKDTDANAFCMPGGKIAVYDGMKRYADTDDKLAIVIGHEIAHAIAKHSSEQITKSIISVAGVAVIFAIISNSDMSDTKKEIAKLVTASGATLTNLKYSRENEAEADRIGLIIASMAGYNPEAAISFWESMKEEQMIDTDHDWFSTHPSNANRIANIRSYMDEAKRYYRK